MFDLCTNFISMCPEPHECLEQEECQQGHRETTRFGPRWSCWDIAIWGDPLVDLAKRSQHNLSGPVRCTEHPRACHQLVLGMSAGSNKKGNKTPGYRRLQVSGEKEGQ